MFVRQGVDSHTAGVFRVSRSVVGETEKPHGAHYVQRDVTSILLQCQMEKKIRGERACLTQLFHRSLAHLYAEIVQKR